jgi:hypothetical protein
MLQALGIFILHTIEHRKVLETNGWTFSPVDIMNAEGDVSLPISGGKRLKEVSVGKHILNYDSMLVLTHFKGHTQGGFGGSLKNISIGCASGKVGKQQIHARPSDGSWPGGEVVPNGWTISNSIFRYALNCYVDAVEQRHLPI